MEAWAIIPSMVHWRECFPLIVCNCLAERKNKHRLNWIYEGDETIKQVEIQSSANGVNFKTIDQIGSEIRSYEYSPFASGAVYYRIRLVSAADEKTFYSNIIVLKGEAAGDFHLLSTIVKNDIRYSATKEFHYQLLDQREACCKMEG